MSRELPYFKWFPADAESDEKYSAMTISERGLYHAALNYAWMNDGLPIDGAEIARVLRVPPRDFMKAWPRVATCFIGTDRLRNNRQEHERAEAKNVSQKASGNAKKRWNRNAPALPPHCEGNARAYESVSVSESKVLSEEKKDAIFHHVPEALKKEPGWPNARDFFEAWKRHSKHDGRESQQLVMQTLMGKNGTVDWHKVIEVHPKYCEYWDRHGWQYCKLTFLGWIECGMPLPPAEATPGVNPAYESPTDRAIRIGKENILRTGRL